MHGPCVVCERGEKTIYVEIHKALYGMIKSPLLFYRSLKKELEQDGFVINPYDPCTAWKMVDGKQLTVVWHVDDIRVSCVLKKAVDDFIEWCRAKWEDPMITKMKPSRGKVHDYLGMILDYSEPGKVQIQMKDYMAKTLSEFKCQDELRATKPVTSPAAEKLFSVNDKAPKLDKAKSEEFHASVAKLLFLTKRA
jgi:hypothetical protein